MNSPKISTNGIANTPGRKAGSVRLTMLSLIPWSLFLCLINQTVMKELFTTIILSFFIGLVTSAQTVYHQRLNTVFDSLCQLYQIKGASASVITPGQPTWNRAYGFAATGIALDTNRVLGIGSNTKTFIAVAILKLQEANLLSLDDTIGTWIQHPNISGQITIRQLLNHTSGLYNYSNNPAFNDSLLSDFTRIWLPEEMLSFIQTPDFSPGAGWGYSNTNYLIAGLVIKAVTNQPIHTALRNLVLQPAGLSSTWFFPQEMPGSFMANPWSIAFGTPYLLDAIPGFGYDNNAIFSMANAAGALVSTSADNARFWDQLVNGQMLSANAFNEMKQWTSIGASASYGLGIFQYRNFNGRTVLSHGGSNIGYINENIADSAAGIVVSVLTNQYSFSNQLLLTRVVAALHRVALQLPTSVTGPSASKEVVIQLYPNPARSVLYVSGMQEGLLRIVNVSGHLTLETRFKEKQAIDVSGIAPGVYQVMLTENNRITASRALIVE